MIKKDIVKKFNNITIGLLNDMKYIIGSAYSIKLTMMLRINSSYAINKFKLNVLKFKKYIIERDPKYFEDETIILNEIEASEEYKKDKDWYMNEYYSLKNIYYNIDKNSKSNFWDILTVLIFLCDKYHS
jgi:hypothetical protein